MRTTTWHAPRPLLEAYLEGRLDAVLGASLERHLDACAACRAAVRPLADLPLLEQAWAGVRADVEAPPVPAVVRVARRLGLPDPVGVLLAAAASLQVAWLSGALVALGFAFVASSFTGDGTLWPFLLVAPLIPVIGVAAAYGPSEDPFEALAVTSPYGRPRLVLVRTLAVVVTTIPAAFLVGLALPAPSWVAAAWLGPAVAMLPLLLALAGFVGPRAAGAVIALLWSGVVVGSVRELPATWPVQATQQAVYLALAIAALVVLMARSWRTRKIGAAL